MNEENEWDHLVETDVVEGPVKKWLVTKLWKAKNEIRKGNWTI